ncbi:MAG TPA: hypothetical protein VGA36_01195 [Nitriliruptorales bacterium]
MRSRALWAQIVAAWELAEGEEVVLENGLRLLDRADEAAAVLAVDGLVVVDRYGGTRAHPMVDLELRGRREFNAVIRQLGVRVVDEPKASRAHRTGPAPRSALRKVG